MTTRVALIVALSTPGVSALHIAASPRFHTPSWSHSNARMVAAEPLAAPARLAEEYNVQLGGLEGKAMRVTMDDIPTKAQVRQAVPADCFKRNTLLSMYYAVQSCVITAACGALGFMLPMKLSALPLWLAYGAATGTAATGMWVVAHECGHGAFSDNRKLQDGVGYLLHSLLLVPYFSWQRSHAVHHAHTNHITKGETHVPLVVDGVTGVENTGGEHELTNAKKLTKPVFGAIQLVLHLVFGWPVYLLFGATGGPAYGVSNHFWPQAPFTKKLWPGQWREKVFKSDIGILATIAALGVWASKTSLASVLAIYGLPLLFTNMWLVGYTWLQHTDVDIPHLAASEFSYMRGAFLTVDRPYGRLFDFLHHKIGSTHVAHHIDCTIPHYRARAATDAIKAAFPKAYLYDPTPVHKALWRVACNCLAVRKNADNRYTWVPP